MLTVAETEIFSRYAADYWTEAEHGEFIAWIAMNPEAGDVIPASGGCRKVRWSRSSIGKRGGCQGDLFQPAGRRKDLATADLRQECQG